MSNPSKFLTLLTSVLLLSCGPLWAADEIEWIEDFDQAKKLAAEQGKDLLIDFTGSDWCPWCWRLTEEVFDMEIFKKEAPQDYIFVKLDFPRKPETIQDPKIKAQNEKLRTLYQEKYQFGGYPTIYLADADGTPFAKTGYQAGGPEKYLASLETLKAARPMEDPGATWIEDFEVAKAKASYHKKDLLVDFTGSDWCQWCWRLSEEVFDLEKFQTDAPKNFVLVKLDYPRKEETKQDPAIKAQNEKLITEYPIGGYPTVYLMDAQGRPYAQTGYQRGGPEAYVKDLARMQEFKVKRDAALAKRRGSTVMVDGERQRVRPEGLELAKILDEALSAVAPAETRGALGKKILNKAYAAEIAQVIELVTDSLADLKAKYEMPKPKADVKAEVKADAKAEEKEKPAIVMALPKGQKIEGIWYDAVSYDYAREIAKKEKKLTFIEFTGSDWCPPCIALEKNVFSKEEFHKWAAKNSAVLVRIEYLRSTEYGPGLKEKVDEIRTDFGIRAWPTICILDPEGQELYKASGFPRGVEKFIEWADAEIAKRK